MIEEVKITMRIYEKFLECFNYEFPDEKRVIEMFENKKLNELIALLTTVITSKTRQLILIKSVTEKIKTELNTIARMRECLSIPESESELPKIKFSMNHKIDEFLSLRQVKKVLDDAGFCYEDGRSMYFDLPVTTAFYCYFKTIATN